tara:strand:+ start:1074 stop:1289 length:216 start_codon:yes stop_codon:yes gene_type:complete
METNETERTAIEFSKDGKVETITVDPANMGDVQAGIEFIYHMREHLIDVGVATAYLFVCYTIYLLLKKYIK